MDASRFRLRAFEESFSIKPLSYFRENRAVEHEIAGSRFWQNILSGEYAPSWNPDEIPASSEGMVWACLLAEAGEWVRLGVRNGYFSNEISPRALPFGGENLVEFENMTTFLAQSNPAWWQGVQDWDAEAFENELDIAMRLLTDDDIEFIRLLYFAYDSEWYEKLSQLDALSSLILRHPDATVTDDVMDGMSWAFFGYAFWPASWGNPAQWRYSVLGNGSQLWMRHDRVEKLQLSLNTLRQSAEHLASNSLENRLNQVLGSESRSQESWLRSRMLFGDDTL